MADVFSRRNALFGWLVWSLAKRRLRKKVDAVAGAPRRGRVRRFVTAVALLAGLAAVWSRRPRGEGPTA